MDEDELIARATRGDGEAFSDLVLRYQDMVYNVAYRILGDEQDAADATQDAFLSAYRAMGTFRGGSFKGWLLRIVTNASYDCLRRTKRHEAASLDGGEDRDWHECLPDPGELPEESAERRDLGRRIQRALMALPAKQRVVLVLVDLQGLSYAEVAHILRVPLGTVRSRMSRGRRALRDRFFDQIEYVLSCQSEDEPMGTPSVALTTAERAGTEARPYGREGSKARTAGGDRGPPLWRRMQAGIGEDGPQDGVEDGGTGGHGGPPLRQRGKQGENGGRGQRPAPTAWWDGYCPHAEASRNRDVVWQLGDRVAIGW